MSLCISSYGYTTAESVRSAAVASAALTRSIGSGIAFASHARQTVRAYERLSAVSQRGVAIEEAQHSRLRTTFWPAEDQFFAEFVQPKQWEAQEVLTDRYAGRMWPPLAAAFARKIRDLECAKPRYCTTAFRRAMQELLVSRAAAKANVLTLAEAIAFAEVEAVNDTNFERRKQAIALRNGLVEQAATLMKSAANGLAATGADSLRAASNAIGAIGRAQSSAASDPGFYNTTGQRLRLNEDGNAVAPEGAFANFEPQDFNTDAWAPDGANSLLGVTQPQNSITANNLTSAPGVMQGGQQQSLARGGTFTFITPPPGVPVTVDIGKLPFTSTAQYKTSSRQSSPSNLPGPPDNNVFYSSGGTGGVGGGGGGLGGGLVGDFLSGLFGGLF